RPARPDDASRRVARVPHRPGGGRCQVEAPGVERPQPGRPLSGACVRLGAGRGTCGAGLPGPALCGVGVHLRAHASATGRVAGGGGGGRGGGGGGGGGGGAPPPPPTPPPEGGGGGWGARGGGGRGGGAGGGRPPYPPPPEGGGGGGGGVDVTPQRHLSPHS